jgi:hypothetical protein
MRILLASTLLAAATMAASPTLAQDTSANPNYGTIQLSAGFNNDPRSVSVVSGGSIPASNVGGQCSGYISRAPDLRLVYEAGSLPLIISVASDADTTLVVNAPDGSWHCDDDGGLNGLNPARRFPSPLSGRYEIWVGSYTAGTNSRAQIYISEVGSQ